VGDRFYMQQKLHKPKRVLKKDVIARLTRVLNGNEVKGLDRLTIQSLDDLTETLIGTFGLDRHDTN
jgi:hypothetical protein